MYLQIGLSLLIRRANSLNPAVKMLIQKFVPFPAVGKYSLHYIGFELFMICLLKYIYALFPDKFFMGNRGIILPLHLLTNHKRRQMGHESQLVPDGDGILVHKVCRELQFLVDQYCTLAPTSPR